RRHTRFDCDWSSDVCSSDLIIITVVATGFDASYYAARPVRELEGAEARSAHTKTDKQTTDMTDFDMDLQPTIEEATDTTAAEERSEERRVGKEGREEMAWVE